MSALRKPKPAGLSTNVGAGCLTQTGAPARSTHQKGGTVVDPRFAVNWVAGPQPSAEQAARMLDVLRPDLAAPDELRGRVSATARRAAEAAPPAGAGAIVSAAPVTVAELQGALRAVWAGQFAARNLLGPARIRWFQPHPGRALSGRVVMVVGCHGGAGASVVALAVAQAAGEFGRSVRLLDCASAERSGLLTAVDAELGVDGSGWRRGRRARLFIDRVADQLASAAEVPAPADEPLSRAEVTVVDTGWGAGAVLSGGSWLAQVAESAGVVLVARATVPALRQVEQAMAICHGATVVAVQGPTRWHRSVRATAGRQLLAAEASGRVVTVATDRHLLARGITSAPLPRAVLEAGRQILARVLAADPQMPAAQDLPGPR